MHNVICGCLCRRRAVPIMDAIFPSPFLRLFLSFICFFFFFFLVIQVDIGGHPPSPTGPKHVSCNFGNLLFLAVFSDPELPGPF
jgi:hypothetical protein